MFYKLNTKRLLKKGVYLNKNNFNSLKKDIYDIYEKNGKVVILFIGSPGSGKTKVASWIHNNGFLSLSKDQLCIIDDLCGEDNRRYNKSELKTFTEKIKNKIVIIFDYKAAVYIRNPDLIIYLSIDEKRRLMNLKKRSRRGSFFITCSDVLYTILQDYR